MLRQFVFLEEGFRPHSRVLVPSVGGSPGQADWRLRELRRCIPPAKDVLPHELMRPTLRGHIEVMDGCKQVGAKINPPRKREEGSE